MAAPDVPAWLDCTKGALSCQHSSIEMALEAAIVVMLRREGTGGVWGEVKAGMMKVERLTRIPEVRRIVMYVYLFWAESFVGYGRPAACTAECGRKLTAGSWFSFSSG